MTHRIAVTGSALLALTAGLAATTAANAADTGDLFDLSIEQLVNLEVTSVARKAESLSDTASAVYVVTREDIEQHGVRTIPDALRLAPGLSVLQVDANKWAVSARGFQGRFSNKLLVMMDGRMLYTPSFSGVWWDVQNTLIEEIERIEIIRGPGAVVWGTNAVNGVVNIITRSASREPETELITGVDPYEAPFIGLRINRAAGDDGSVGFFAKHQQGAEQALLTGEPANDDWEISRMGLRFDREDAKSSFSVSSEAYTGEIGSSNRQVILTPPFERYVDTDADIAGGFVLAQYSISGSKESRTSVQAYIDYSERRDPELFSEDRLTVSTEIQHQRQVGKHAINVGLSGRVNDFEFAGSNRANFADLTPRNDVFSAFIQDEIPLGSENLLLTLGLKAESNDLSPESVEWMPNIRLRWNPTDDYTVWGAVTRAVRSPSVADRSVELLDIGPLLLPGDPLNPTPLLGRQGTIGNPNFESEIALSFEAGVRGQISSNLGFDLALFAVEYDGIRSLGAPVVLCAPSGISITEDPLCIFSSTNLNGLARFTNEDDAEALGGELSVDWQVVESLRIRSSISIANDRQITENPAAFAQSSFYPTTQGNIRFEWNAADRGMFSFWARYVDDIEGQNIDGYWQANVHWRYAVNDKVVISAGVRNLLDDDNPEFRSDIFDVRPTAIETSAFANLRFTF